MQTTPEAFATEDDARCAIVEACLRMGRLGINQGKSGNVSVRWDRGGAPGLLVTPTALAYEQMGPDDIVWLSIALAEAPQARPAMSDGTRAPSSEWRMHRDVYAARPDAQAVVHAHPVHATTLACLPQVQRDGIPAFHYMIAVAGGADIRCAPYATFGSAELSRLALAALEGRRACLLGNHGLLVFHDALDRALDLAVEVETLCRVYRQALQLGPPALIDAQEMARVVERMRSGGYA
jgi:L-fuculose-phosphate aldolase